MVAKYGNFAKGFHYKVSLAAVQRYRNFTLCALNEEKRFFKGSCKVDNTKTLISYYTNIIIFQSTCPYKNFFDLYDFHSIDQGSGSPWNKMSIKLCFHNSHPKGMVHKSFLNVMSSLMTSKNKIKMKTK